MEYRTVRRVIPVVNTSELQLGDRIMRLLDSGDQRSEPDLEGGVTTVKQIADGKVSLFRPYTHTADFSSTGGVICYVGIEEYNVELDRDLSWLLIQRVTLK